MKYLIFLFSIAMIAACGDVETQPQEDLSVGAQEEIIETQIDPTANRTIKPGEWYRCYRSECVETDPETGRCTFKVTYLGWCMAPPLYVENDIE